MRLTRRPCNLDKRSCHTETQHPHIRRIDVESAGEMYEATSREFTDADAGILCAAVADFTPESVADHKIKREKTIWYYN